MAQAKKKLTPQIKHRSTRQRRAIIAYLQSSKDHPTADQIYDALKAKYSKLSLATVYNTLQYMAAQGNVNILGEVGDNRLHYDARMDPHIHVACTACHCITDIGSDLIAEISDQVSRKSGYDISGSRVLYYGICPDCQQKTTKQQLKQN